MKKLLVITPLAIALIAGVLACKKSLEQPVQTLESKSTTSVDPLTKKVREFNAETKNPNRKTIENATYLSIQDAIFISEAALNYTHDDSLSDPTRYYDTLTLSVSVNLLDDSVKVP